MFSFMKKDKDHKKDKEEHKKEKEERKKEKKDKKEKDRKEKHREPVTPEELKRLEEVKKGVFSKKSDHKQEVDGRDSPDDGGFSARIADSSTSIASEGNQLQSVETACKIPPAIMPKPKSILKSKGEKVSVSENLEDVATLKMNTAYNVEMTAYPVVDEKVQIPKSVQSSLKGSMKNRPPEFTPPPPPESPPPEKSFNAALKLPDIVLSKPPRVRELVIKRSDFGGFGFTLRKGPQSQKFGDSSDTKQTVIFAEPLAGQSSLQTGLIPGDRLIEVNGVNVENKPREEVIEMIKNIGDQVILKVQPIAELIELSVRPSMAGSAVDIQDDVVKGGTLKRSGSMRYKLQVRIFI